MLSRYQVNMIRPQAWKAHHSLLKAEKDESLALARTKWPKAPLSLKKHHGRAEALLIADYAREYFA
jgi:hypothetical protein